MHLLKTLYTKNSSLPELIAASLEFNQSIVEEDGGEGDFVSIAHKLNELLEIIPFSKNGLDAVGAEALYDANHSEHAYLHFRVDELDFYIVKNDKSFLIEMWKILAVYETNDRRHLIGSHGFTGKDNSGDSILQDIGIYTFIGRALAAVPDFCSELESAWVWPEGLTINLIEMFWQEGEGWQRGWSIQSSMTPYTEEVLVHFRRDVYWKQAHLRYVYPHLEAIGLFKRYEVDSLNQLGLISGELVQDATRSERMNPNWWNIRAFGSINDNPPEVGSFTFDPPLPEVKPVDWLKDFIDSERKELSMPIQPDENSILVDGALGFAKSIE